jgi:hypothetical protein
MACKDELIRNALTLIDASRLALHRRKILLSGNENIIVRMRDLQHASITSKSRGIHSVTAS